MSSPSGPCAGWAPPTNSPGSAPDMAAAAVESSPDHKIGRTTELHDITVSEGLLQDLDVVHENSVRRVLHWGRAYEHTYTRTREVAEAAGGAEIKTHALGHVFAANVNVPQGSISETHFEVKYTILRVPGTLSQQYSCSKNVKPQTQHTSVSVEVSYIRKARKVGRAYQVSKDERRLPPSVSSHNNLRVLSRNGLDGRHVQDDVHQLRASSDQSRLPVRTSHMSQHHHKNKKLTPLELHPRFGDKLVLGLLLFVGSYLQ